MIEINNTTKAKIPSNFVKKVVTTFLRQMKFKVNTDVSIVLVGDKKMRGLNKSYRKQDRITDVLAFSNLEGGELITPKGEPPYLGEVIICYPQAKRQAKEIRQGLREEIKVLLIHGLLHLLGYEHRNQVEQRVMQRLEARLIK